MPRKLDRARFAKVVKDSKNGKWEPTIEQIVFWYKNINSLIFKDELPELNSIIIKHSNKHWGQAYCHNNNDDTLKIVQIHFTKEFKSFKHFLNTLSHEMVHIWEWITFQRMTHGKNFFLWEEKFKRIGIDIK